MHYAYFFLLLPLVICFSGCVQAQHEDIPYQDVANICETCTCLTAQDAYNHAHHTLSCAMKNFRHILARWPTEFGSNHNGVDIIATFSANTIAILQQLPATNATLTFTCRHCGIKQLQSPTFMDVPYIKRLDLSWNEIPTDELTPDVFRGPYRLNRYEPIALAELDISHNRLRSLDRRVFEHTPQLRKLNLSFNNFTVLDNAAVAALASVKELTFLDLSYTNIGSISEDIFKALARLRALNLAGNKFTVMPAHLELVGRSLEVLNVAGNQLTKLEDKNFQGLKVLKRLNVSDMPSLKSVAKDTFSLFETLEYLHCARNPNLVSFDLDSLLHCTKLSQLDLSYCGLTTISLNLNFSQAIASNGLASNETHVARPWARLHVFETVGNPWLCDCDLLRTLEFIGSHHRYQESETRCESPYVLAGARLSSITAEQICSRPLPKKYRVIDEDPPRFLRKRYIILTFITAAVVIVLGVMIGFVVSCIRRKLRSDFGVEPIRYTSVRSSNLSSFAHTNPNNLTGHA